MSVQSIGSYQGAIYAPSLQHSGLRPRQHSAKTSAETNGAGKSTAPLEASVYTSSGRLSSFSLRTPHLPAPPDQPKVEAGPVVGPLPPPPGQPGKGAGPVVGPLPPPPDQQGAPRV